MMIIYDVVKFEILFSNTKVYKIVIVYIQAISIT